MASTPGRNDPCPFGSGRKYKQCCLQRLDAEDTARIRLRAAEGRVVDAALEFAADEFGESILGVAWQDFWYGTLAPDDIAGTPEFEQMFLPWFVFEFVIDLDDERGDLDAFAGLDLPIARLWVESQGAAVPEFDRRFVEVACRSPLSVCVVERVEAGRSIDLRDVLTGARFHVLEQGASRVLREADLTFTRVITIDGASIMQGASPLIVPPEWHTHIIDWRTRLFGKRLLSRDDLEDRGAAVRALYAFVAHEVRHPRPPDLRNTDGDRLVPTTMRFDLGVSVDEAFAKLKPLATLGREEHVSEVERDESGAMTRAVLSWVKRGNRQHSGWNNTVLGTLRLERSHLVVEVNSKRRAGRVIREIAKRLGDGAVLVDQTVTDVAEALAERAALRDEGALPEPPEPPPELLAMQDEAMRRHWQEWLHMPVPALGNKTPRQARRSAEGRERLEARLGEFERRAADAGMATAPFADLRRTLRLEKPAP